MPYSQNLRILVGKLETEAGTAVTLEDADFDVAIRNPEVTPTIPPDEDNSKYATGDHGEDAAIMGAQSGTVAFNIKMCEGADKVTEPKWWKFAHACGAVTKLYSGTGIALQPLKSGDDTTMTIGVYDIEQGANPKAMLYLFAGCMGTMVFGADNIGMPWNAAFSFSGKLVDIQDVDNADIPILTSPDSALSEKMLNNTMAFGGIEQCISNFSLDTGNTINPLICQNEDTGYKYYSISERRPRFSFNPLSKRVVTEVILAKILASSNNAVSLASANMALTIPVTQMLAPGIANREGYVNWDHTLRCLRNAGTDADLPDEATWELLIGARTA